VEKEVEEFNKISDLMERRFLIETALDILIEKFPGVKRGSLYKQTLRENLDFVKNQQMALKLGSSDVAQQNIIYKTLSQSDSTIANLLQQMTPLTESLYNTFKSTLSQWTIEIDSDLQEALKGDAKTIKENFNVSSASPEISKYDIIFKRLQKKYNELNNLIQNIGTTIDDRSSINLNPNEP
jgi:hemerythrin-like domain-containing protein